MAELVDINVARERFRTKDDATLSSIERTGGGSGGGGDMEQRLKKLEDHVGDIREGVAAIRATLEHAATKADVSDMALRMIMWAVATVIASAGIAFTIVRYASPPSPPPNYIISVPATPTPAPAPPVQNERQP